jgi:hypothetical protein
MSETIFDLIRVKNIGSDTLVLRGNTQYVIPVDSERIIPFNEAASWFGDPRLSDNGRDRSRTDAFRLTQNLWGYSEGMKYPRDRNDPAQGFLRWEDFKPQVECFDMDGNLINFLIHDPSGELGVSGSVPGLSDPSLLDAATLSKQVDKMSEQIAKLQSLLTERTRFDAATHVDANVPYPSPAPAVEDVHEHIARIEESVILPSPPADDVVSEDAPRTVRTGSRGK